jgi:hypothetical protein
MSHWAELDETNKVIRVLVGDNNEPDEGKATIESLGGTWVQTSYNGNFRYNYAGIGFTYDPIDDAFIAPSPDCNHDTVLLNNQKRWECSACDELATIK